MMSQKYQVHHTSLVLSIEDPEVQSYRLPRHQHAVLPLSNKAILLLGLMLVCCLLVLKKLHILLVLRGPRFIPGNLLSPFLLRNNRRILALLSSRPSLLLPDFVPQTPHVIQLGLAPEVALRCEPRIEELRSDRLPHVETQRLARAFDGADGCRDTGCKSHCSFHQGASASMCLAKQPQAIQCWAKNSPSPRIFRFPHAFFNTSHQAQRRRQHAAPHFLCRLVLLNIRKPQHPRVLFRLARHPRPRIAPKMRHFPMTLPALRRRAARAFRRGHNAGREADDLAAHPVHRRGGVGEERGDEDAGGDVGEGVVFGGDEVGGEGGEKRGDDLVAEV
mmetsp:Transcript_22889/g.56877  ORF Transcript_22889/g.56877 Transcript_22889/m.56877 type:complete len:333 (-) Transcript_22889:555-1553(-)